MLKAEDVIGQKFGRLTVVSLERATHYRITAFCKCDCGKSCKADLSNLKQGKKKSCGCLAKEAIEVERNRMNLMFNHNRERKKRTKRAYVGKDFNI